MTRNTQPKDEVTLRATLNRVLLITLGLVTAVTMGILFAYAQIKQTVSTRTVVSLLEKTSSAQAGSLIPSFLIPEEHSGAAVLLDRFKKEDGLQDIRIFLPGENLPADFSSCKLAETPTSCLDQEGHRIAYAAPIREGNQNFGYLVKVKSLTDPLANDTVLRMIEAASIALVLVFMGLFLVSSRLTARMVPDELSNLAAWVESVLLDRTSAKVPRLRFKELNDLAGQIAQILERHERARDQAVIGQLTSGIMHDIRTPIAPIVAAHLLTAEQAEGSEKRLKRLENLFKACSTNLPIIGNLIESVLDGSREIHIERQSADLRDTIKQATALLSQRVSNRNIELNVNLGAAPVVVEHDPSQMIRVFANVLRNSIDAIDEARGQNPKHLARFNISVEPSQDGGAHVRMEDSGHGLPADPEKVFRVFRSSKPRGSGLGLIISRKIVEAHRGRMTAGRSEHLEGAQFDIVLPADSAAKNGNATEATT